MRGGYESDITEKEIKKEEKEKMRMERKARDVRVRRAFSTAGPANSAIV